MIPKKYDKKKNFSLDKLCEAASSQLFNEANEKTFEEQKKIIVSKYQNKEGHSIPTELQNMSSVEKAFKINTNNPIPSNFPEDLLKNHAKPVEQETFDKNTLVYSSQLTPSILQHLSVSQLSPNSSTFTLNPSISTTISNNLEKLNENKLADTKTEQNSKNECHFCGKFCSKPSILQKHLRTHTNERPYSCSECSMKFKTKSNLSKHYKSKTHQIQTESNKQVDVEHDENYAQISNKNYNLDDKSKQRSFQDSQNLINTALDSNLSNPYSSLNKILSSPLHLQNNDSNSNMDIKTQSQVLSPPYMPLAFKLIPNNTSYSFIIQPPIMSESHSNLKDSLKSEQMLLNSSSENLAALYNINSKQNNFYLNDNPKISNFNKSKQNSEKNEQKEKKKGFNSKDISERISEIISKNNSIILDMPKIDKPRSKKVGRAYSDNKPTPPKIETVLRASSLTPTQSSESSTPIDPRQLINTSSFFNSSNSIDGDDFKQKIVTQTQQTNKNASNSQHHPNLYLLVSNPNHLISINSNFSHPLTTSISELVEPINITTSQTSMPSIKEYRGLQTSPINVSTHINRQNLLSKSKSFCDSFNILNTDEVSNVFQKHVLVKSLSESQNSTFIHKRDFQDINENLKISNVQERVEKQINDSKNFMQNNIYHQASQNPICKKQENGLLSDGKMVISKNHNDNQDKNISLSSLNKLLLKPNKNECHELKIDNKSLAPMPVAPSTMTPNLTFNNSSSVGILISQSFCTSSNELTNILLKSSEFSQSNLNQDINFNKSETSTFTASSTKRAGRPRGSKNKKQSGLSKNNNQSIPAIKISYADNGSKEIDSKIELKKHILMKRSLSNDNENKIINAGRNLSLDLNETLDKNSCNNISSFKNNITFDAKLIAMKDVHRNGLGNVSQEESSYLRNSFSTCSVENASVSKQTLVTSCALEGEKSYTKKLKNQENHKDLRNVHNNNILNTATHQNISVFNHKKQSSSPATGFLGTSNSVTTDQNSKSKSDQLTQFSDTNDMSLNYKSINFLESKRSTDNILEIEKKLQSERKYQLSIPIKKRRKTLTELGRGTTFGTTVDDNIDALNKTSSMLNKTKPLWRSAGSPNEHSIECSKVEENEHKINSSVNNVNESDENFKTKNLYVFKRTCGDTSSGNPISNSTNSINTISTNRGGVIEDNSLKRKIIDSLNLRNDVSSVETSLNSLSTLTNIADGSKTKTVSNLVAYLQTNTTDAQNSPEFQKYCTIPTSFGLNALPEVINSSSKRSVPVSLSDDSEAAASLLDLSKSLHILTQSDQGIDRQAFTDSTQTLNSLTENFSSRLPSSFSSSSILSSIIQNQSTSFNHLLSSILTPINSQATFAPKSTLNSSNHNVFTEKNDGAFNKVTPLPASTISTNNYFMHKESYHCQICNEALNKVSSLRTHTLLHSLDKPYKCVKCSVSFNNRWQFNRHNKSKHHFYASFFDSRPFKCIPCRKAFRIKGHLSKHKRSNQHKISKKKYEEMLVVKNQGLSNDAIEDTNQKNNSIVDTLYNKKDEHSGFKYSFKNTIKEKYQNAHETSQNIYSNVVINSQTTETFATSKETNTLGDILISGQKLIRNTNKSNRQYDILSCNDDNDENSSTSNVSIQTNNKIEAEETKKSEYIGKKSKMKKSLSELSDQSIDKKAFINRNRKGKLTHQNSIDVDSIEENSVDNVNSLSKDGGVKRINGGIDDLKIISRKKLKSNKDILFKTPCAVEDEVPVGNETCASLIGTLSQPQNPQTTCEINDKFESLKSFNISTSSSAPNLFSLGLDKKIAMKPTDDGSKGVFVKDKAILYSNVNSGFHSDTHHKLLHTLLQSSSKQGHTLDSFIPSQQTPNHYSSSFTLASSDHDNLSLNSNLEKTNRNSFVKTDSNFVVSSLREFPAQQALQLDSMIKCRWCHRICASLNSLMDHIEEHIEKKVHECSVCKAGFDNKQSLLSHQRLHDLPQNSLSINGFLKDFNAVDDCAIKNADDGSAVSNDEDTECNFEKELKIDTESSENECDGEVSTMTESEYNREKSKITIGNIQSIISGCIFNEKTHDENPDILTVSNNTTNNFIQTKVCISNSENSMIEKGNESNNN